MTRCGLRACGALAAAAFCVTGSALGAIVPDNGGGRFQFPPVTETYVIAPGFPQFQIINGLPPGTTVNVNLSLFGFAGVVDGPGGGLGGTAQGWNATTFWPMQGTGTLAGYNRNVAMPNMSGVTYLAPNPPFTSVAGLQSDLAQLQGQLPFGDPDFDLLRITAGTNFGMPSPGLVNGTVLGPPGSNWQIDSFFDITYRIDFVGHPGSPFGGLSGSTNGQTRIWIIPAPGGAALLALAGLAAVRRRR